MTDEHEEPQERPDIDGSVYEMEQNKVVLHCY